MHLKISTRPVGSVTVVDLSGPLTLGENSQSLRDGVSELVRKGQKRILLNLAEVHYVDSSGLAAIVSSLAAVTRAGGNIKLLSLQKRVAELVRITRLSSVLEIYSDESEAVQSYGA